MTEERARGARFTFSNVRSDHHQRDPRYRGPRKRIDLSAPVLAAAAKIPLRFCELRPTTRDSTLAEDPMSISGIGGGQAAAVSTLLTSPGAASAGSIAGAATGAALVSELIANLDAATIGVSSALDGLSSALGAIIDTSA
jgi:hypothetical protein